MKANKFMILVLLLISSTAFANVQYLKHLRKDKGKIDVVYTWVDGQDPAWQRAKESFSHGAYKATPESMMKNRFRNRDELKYSLRSINKFAKFIDHIYIVTCGQKPVWLKPHKKITIIDHKTIFRNQGNLPTFSSLAIEANLHHIPNLHERFIYFNDDVFLGRNVTAKDFFSDSGKIKLFLSGRDSAHGPVTPNDIGYIAACKNNNRFLDYHFGYRRRKYLEHAPFALRKSHLKQFETFFPSIIQNVSSHRFRSSEDYGMTCGLIQHFAMHHHQARSGKLKSYTVNLSNDIQKNRDGLSYLFHKRPHTFCLADVAAKDSAGVDFQLLQFLELYYPQKAPWEH